MCFVSLDSIEGQSNGSDQVWRKIQETLEGLHSGSNHNLPGMLYRLKSKKVLMVLDNVESQDQLDVLRTGAEDVDGGPDYRLWAKLKVCYNVLLPSEKEIFLDVATLFHGFPLLMVKKYIWTVSREVPHLAWLNLKSRFLVSVQVDGLIQMHAQLRNLGHNIACPRTATVEKWKRISRYSLTNEVRGKLVSKNKGLMETLALELYIMGNFIFKPKNATFHNYGYLQYLMLEGGRPSSVTVRGKLKLPRSLVYLRWKRGLFTVCPLEFTSLKKLAVLELLNCRFMTSLPHSILNATRLTWLELRGCSALAELPSGLSKCLEYLGLNGTCLRDLPDDFGNLKKLVHLEVQHTKMSRVPEGLGGLEMLSCLDLSNTGMTTLPDSIDNLKRLRYLNVERTMLTSLPDSIGGLQGLEELHLAYTMLGSLPESIGGLQELWHLRLHRTCVESLPQSIGDLAKLERLILEFTPLEALPDSIGKLCNLLTLGLVGTQLSTLPEIIGELAVLQDLNLPSLQSVPQTLRKLSRLRCLMIDMGTLVQSVELEEARPQGGADSASAPRDWLSESTILSSVPHDLPFHAMGVLTLSGRGYLQSWIQPLFQRLQNMPSLWCLRLLEFDLVETIPCELGTLTSLLKLEIIGWERLRELPESLGKLCELHFLRLRNNPSLCRLPQSLGQLCKLASLYLENNTSLSTLPESVSALASLEHLRVRNCGSIHVSPSEEWTQPNSLQAMAAPRLVTSDSWSLVEYFLDGCGEHSINQIDYYAECEEMEKAIKLAIKTRTDSENVVYYVLQTKMAVELFGGHFSGVDYCRRRSFRPSASRHARHQHLRILCKTYNCKIHRCKICVVKELKVESPYTDETETPIDHNY